MFPGTDTILIPPRVRDGEPDLETVPIGREGAVPDAPAGELVVTCRVCQRARAKYTCPRCSTRYCGLPCYKAHDTGCVESFHGENFGDALKGTQAEDDGKKQMTEILARFAKLDAGEADGQGDELDADDEEEEEDGEDGGAAPSSSGVCILSEANLEKLARGEELCAEDLSPEERAAFERSAATGELSHMVESWKAWWTLPEASDIVLASDGGRLVREVESEGGSAGESPGSSSAVPPPPDEPLPPLARLTPVKPSQSLRWHLLDVLGGYTLTLRAHDGDWSADPLAAVATLLSLSAVLSAGAERPSRATGGAAGTASTDLPCTAASALHGVGSRAASSASGVMAAAAAAASAGGMTRDVLALLRGGRGAAVVALADTRRMVLAAAADLPGGGDGSGTGRGGSGRLTRAGWGSSGLSRGALSRLERKVFFLLCWVNGLTDSARDDGEDRADEGVFEILRGRLEHELRVKEEAEAVAATRAAVVHPKSLVTEVVK